MTDHDSMQRTSADNIASSRPNSINQMGGATEKGSSQPSIGVDVDQLEAGAVTIERDRLQSDSCAVPSDHVPPVSQSMIVVLLNFLLNVTFFIIVPTSASYASELGASTWFSGLTIGISVFVSGMLLVPFSRRYGKQYRLPFLLCPICLIVGEIMYALGGVADTAWMLFAGRVVIGGGFLCWMFVKRYMTDSIVVGASKRTTMAAWLVTSQAGGMAVGPFIGGVLSKKIRPMTDEHRLWNGFTASGWVMAGIWALFFALTYFVFRDPVPPSTSSIELNSPMRASAERSKDDRAASAPPTLKMMYRDLNSTQKFSVFTMCWFSMVNFLVLGAWETNIPVFGHIRFGWSEYNAGNVIALGGIATMPILFALVFASKYLQDRLILAAGLLFGLLGLSLHMGTLESPAKSAVALLGNSPINFGSFFTSWFLVALGYNMLTTITLALLSKQIPAKYNGLASTVIQLSNNVGRVTGALWGSVIYQVGQFGIISLELAVTLIGACLVGLMWRKMDVRRG